jgi:hypothetical protein
MASGWTVVVRIAKCLGPVKLLCLPVHPIPSSGAACDTRLVPVGLSGPPLLGCRYRIVERHAVSLSALGTIELGGSYMWRRPSGLPAGMVFINSAKLVPRFSQCPGPSGPIPKRRCDCICQRELAPGHSCPLSMVAQMTLGGSRPCD